MPRIRVSLRNLFLTLLVTHLAGCMMHYGPTDFEAAKPSKEQQIRTSISDYTKKSLQERGQYRGFLYGELYVTKTKEIIELDELIDRRNILPTLEDQYGNRLDSAIAAQDHLIALKKQEIKEKNLYPLYEISHLFSVMLNEKEFEIYEFDFNLYPNYTIKDVKQLMVVQLDAAKYRQFVHLMEQRPLTDNYQIDVAYYTQFFTALENEKVFKAELLVNILQVMEFILKHGNFDQHAFCRQLAEDWMKKNANYASYKSLGFKPQELQPVLTKVEGQGEYITGYNLTHQFQFIQDNAIIDSELKFEFDLNFLLIRVYT
jgi:hypothetical protein